MTLLAMENRIDAAQPPCPVVRKSFIAKSRRASLVIRRETPFSLSSVVVTAMAVVLILAGIWLPAETAFYVQSAGGVALIFPVGQFVFAIAARDAVEHENRAVEDIALFDNGILNPARYRKRHPERVRAYEAFADELDISINPTTRRLPKNAHLYEAASLVLSGRVAAEDTHLITTVLARGITDREEIAAVVLAMKNHGNALAQGSL